MVVIGVGGAGCNAVNNMVEESIEITTYAFNTDEQTLIASYSDKTLQIGPMLTKGTGAGSIPDVGKKAAEESYEDIKKLLQGYDMVFITAGMGGGTGTGAAPIIAKIAKELSILTVTIVTKPFHFEGIHRMKIAEIGLEEIQKYSDTIMVIPNQNLFSITDNKTTFSGAFKMADSVLLSAVRGISDLIIKPGLINLDFADIKCVMSEMGEAMIGLGEASSADIENDSEKTKAIIAAEKAIYNPLLDDSCISTAKGLLINIIGGNDMTLFEIDSAVNRIREEVKENTKIIFGCNH